MGIHHAPGHHPGPQLTPFTLRTAAIADVSLAYEITKSAMAEYVERTWGVWSDAEQLLRHRESFDPSKHELVLVQGNVAGLLATEVESGHLQLGKLYLLPQYRNNGLGAAILATILARARTLERPVRLRVLRVNSGARRFYERNGFAVFQEEPERFFMERAV